MIFHINNSNILTPKKIRTILFWSIILVVFLAGLSVKIWNLQQAYSFDDDEIFSALFIQNTWHDILTLKAYDSGNPPLYFLLLKGWSCIFGVTEVGIRSFSLMIDCISFWLLFWFCKKKLNFNRFQLITISTLFSFSQAMFHYSIYGRAYALLVLLCILILYFWTKDSKELVNWYFVGASLVGLYSHYSTVFFLYFLALAIIIDNCINWRGWKKIKKIAVNYGLIIIGYLPWIIMFIRDQIRLDSMRKYSFWQTYPSTDYLKTRIGLWLTIISNSIINLDNKRSSVIMIILGCLLVVYLYKNTRVTKNNKFNIILIMVFMYLISLYCLGLGKILVVERYSLFILPLIWVCFVEIVLKKLNWVKILLATIMLGFWVVNQRSFYIPVNGNSGKKIADSMSGKVIIIEECSYKDNFNYYYNGDSEIRCDLPLEKIEIVGNEEMNLLENKWNDKSGGLWTSVDVENWIMHKMYILLDRAELDNGYTIFKIMGN